ISPAVVAGHQADAGGDGHGDIGRHAAAVGAADTRRDGTGTWVHGFHAGGGGAVVAGQHPVGASEVVAGGVVQGANDGQLVHDSGLARHQVANVDARHVGGGVP